MRVPTDPAPFPARRPLSFGSRPLTRAVAGAEMQLSPNLRWLKEQLDEGLLGGRLLQIDAYGKMDRRAG